MLFQLEKIQPSFILLQVKLKHTYQNYVYVNLSYYFLFYYILTMIFCILPKAISYGNCHMKILYKIRVKRSKLFQIGGRTPLPYSSMVSLLLSRYFNFCPWDKLPSPNLQWLVMLLSGFFNFCPWDKLPSSIFQW